MNRIVPLAAIFVVALVLTACGSSKTSSAQTQAAAIAANPEVKANLAKGEASVKACVSKGNFLTGSGRKAVFACIAPPGQLPALEACAQKAITTNGFLSSAARKKDYQALAVCAEEHR